MIFTKIISIYIKTFTESIVAVLKSWKQVLIQIPALIIFGILSSVTGSLGMVGGLILGMFSALVVSYYLVLVRSVVLNEKFSLEIIKQEGLMLFSPAISVFFALFLIQIVMSFIQVTFLKIAVGILISVLLNPIVEFLYLEESNLGDLVERSYDFVSRNFISWFMPMFLCISPIVIKQPGMLPLIFSQDPLNMLQSFIGTMGGLFSVPARAISFVPILYISFFIMVFRGKLLLKLR